MGQGNGPNPVGVAGTANASVRRRVSVDRGARIAETGSLVGRRRGGSTGIGE